MPPIKPLTPLQRHIRDWKDCTKCPLHQTRKQVVFGRGKLPADVVLVGEGPGKSEDVLGEAFVGPAGHLIDRIVANAMPEGRELRLFFTNLVGCIPLEEEGGNKTAEPDPSDIKACAPRLQEIVKIADPKLIVMVGTLAQSWLDKRFMGTKFHNSIPTIHIDHPARILRSPEAQKGLMERRATVILRDKFQELVEGKLPKPTLNVTSKGRMFDQQGFQDLHDDEDIPF